MGGVFFLWKAITLSEVERTRLQRSILSRVLQRATPSSTLPSPTIAMINWRMFKKQQSGPRAAYRPVEPSKSEPTLGVQANSSRKSILMSGHAEGLMLSLSVWLLYCGATKQCTCVAFKSTIQYSKIPALL
jgi:hypothetical protein